MRTTANRVKENSKKISPALTKPTTPVIWAIDSSKLKETDTKKFQDILKSLKYADDGVVPTSIFSPFDLGWIMPVDKKMKKETLDSISPHIIEQWKKLSIPTKKTGLLLSDSGSIRERAGTLIQFAQRQKSKMIAVGTGGKSRANPTGLGSFTETLISISPIPVLVVSENAKSIQQVSRILYPTDFSEVSYGNFKKVVQFAQSYNAEVILYHYLDLEAGPLTFGIPWGYELRWLDEYWKVQEELKQAEGEKWKAWAEKQNVKCKFTCDRKIGGLRERILETAQENQVDILTLGIKRGPWSQVILGRNVREILAHSNCPVLTLHSEIEKKRLHS